MAIHSNNVSHHNIIILLQIPKDWVLFAIIVLVVTVDLLIILVGTAIPSSRLNATSVRDAQHPTATDVSAYKTHNLQYQLHNNILLDYYAWQTR